MIEKEKVIIKETAIIFKECKEEIVNNWLGVVEEELKDIEHSIKEVLESAINELVQSFIEHLSQGNFEAYYNSNRIVGRNVAQKDISFSLFIDAFHHFEESYFPTLKQRVSEDRLLSFLSAIDQLHHNTISILAQEYFEIKDATIFAMAKLAEHKDPETGKHLERTRRNSRLLAQALGEGKEFIENIHRAGPLHDIGKVGIPDHILKKPGKLTKKEYEEMKKHTLIGGETIDSIIDEFGVSRGYLIFARDIAKHHHEKYDGTGYPYGLKGEDIPLAARIFALTDAYDAIVSKRVYKDALPHEEAVRRIKADAGTHFDPHIVKTFLKVHQEFQESTYSHL